MEKIFLIILNILVLIIACLSKSIPKELIPDLLLAERSKCDYQTKPDLTNILNKHGVCNITTPMFKPDDYLETRFPSACFGFYDAIFRLCEIADSPVDAINTNPYLINSTNLCTVASSTISLIKYEYKNEQTNNWLKLFKSIMSDKDECTDLCIHKNDVNPICQITITSLKLVVGEEPSRETNIEIISKETHPEPPKDEKTQSKETPKSVLIQETVTKEEKKKVDIEQRVVPKPVTEELSSVISETVGKPIKSEIPKDIPKDIPKVEDNPNFEQPDDSKLMKNDPNVPEDEGKLNDLPDESILPDADGSSKDEKEETLSEPANPKIPEMEISTGISDRFVDAEDSNFFTYFAMMTAGCIFAYVFFHNKNKILALALEGRKVRSSRGKGRHSSTSYSRLHSNLGEAIASDETTPSSTHVLF